MAGSNGSGNSDDEVTPVETPQATLAEHRPYVLALAGCIAPLHEALNTLGEVLHEFRVAKVRVSQSLLDNLRDAGTQIKGVGEKIEEAFSK